MDMPRHDRFEVVFGDMEYLSDTAKEGQFPLVDQSIGLGDMEQAVDDAFQHFAIVMAGTAETGQPLGIGLVSGNVLTREIIKTGNVSRFFFGKIEDLAEGAHLGIVNDAVSLRHLGGECDNRDGKGNLAPRLRVPFKEGADGFNHASKRTACRVADCAEQPLPQG